MNDNEVIEFEATEDDLANALVEVREHYGMRSKYCLVAQATRRVLGSTSVGSTTISLYDDPRGYKEYNLDKTGRLLVELFDDNRYDDLLFPVKFKATKVREFPYS